MYRKEKRKLKKRKINQQSEKRTVSHHLYGEIPLIKRDSIWRCDPDFQPKLPPNAVRGDVRKQEFCYWCHFPKYFYIDEDHRCIECGIEFTFSASEQKFWYEDLKFNFYSKPIRCSDCRRKKRNENALKVRLTDISNKVNESPSDPEILIEYAEVTYDYFRYFGRGNLAQAISSARKAFGLSPTSFEALYWEAACQDAAGHSRKANQTYQYFLDVSKPTNRYKLLLKQAEQRLEELKEFSIE